MRRIIALEVKTCTQIQKGYKLQEYLVDILEINSLHKDYILRRSDFFSPKIELL